MASDNNDLISLTADIVSAHVSNNTVAIGDVGRLVQQVHGALMQLGAAAPEPQPAPPEPAVSVRASVKSDAITCLVCGKKQKTLKRHIANAHDMSPAEYRETFGLKPDYPMVAPEYTARRSELAKSIGLGKKGIRNPES